MVKAEKLRPEAQVGGVVKVAWKEVKGVGFYIRDFLDLLVLVGLVAPKQLILSCEWTVPPSLSDIQCLFFGAFQKEF